MAKTTNLLSSDEVAKLKHQVNESRAETTILSSEVKDLQEKL